MKWKAVEWIRRSPERFASLTAMRIVSFWFGPFERPAFSVVVASFSVFGFLGIWRMYKRLHSLNAVLLLAALATYPLPYYFVQFSLRYTVPIRWIVVLAACWFVHDVFRERGRTGKSPSTE